MYTIQEREYKNLKYFKNLSVIQPSETLVRLRRNVFMWGGFMLFIFFAGLVIKGFTGGFITADITNTFLIPTYVGVFFFYNYIQYFLQLNNEYSAHSSKSSNIQSYGNELTLYLFKREFDVSNLRLYEQSYTYGLCGKGPKEQEKSYKVQCDILKPGFLEECGGVVIQKDGFSIYEGKLFFEYVLSEDDMRFYNKHYDQLKNASVSEFLHYIFPVWFGGFVTVLIIYTLIAHYFSLSPLSHFIGKIN